MLKYLKGSVNLSENEYPLSKFKKLMGKLDNKQPNFALRISIQEQAVMIKQ